jgi:polyketide cyclase/dehydrase/lipid transport protein
MPSETRHLTVFIDRTPSEVYDYTCEPRHIPEWAPGLGRGVEQVDGRWYVVTETGRLPVVFAERNALGVLDHDVTLPSGEVVHNPMRVVPHDGGSEVMFTLRRRPEMTDDDFARDAGLVQADLERLKRILERGSAN